MLLKVHEHFSDVAHRSQLLNRITETVVLQFDQLGELRRVQFAYALSDIVIEHESQKFLLSVVVSPEDV